MRDHVAAAIAAQQRRRDAPEAARAAAALLANPATVAVVTGQQAGVFGGPLYTVLKAVSAIQLARRAAQTLGTPVVPIFWVAAEDHDWAEIASVTVLDGQLQPRTVAMPPPEGAGERPVGSLDLDERVTGTLDELAAALAPTRVHALAARLAARRLPARRRRGRCVRPLDRRTARQPRPHRVRLRRPVGQTARVGGVPPRDRHSRAHSSARHHRRRRDGRARTFTPGGAAGRRPLTLPHRSGDGSPHADQVSGRQVRGRRDHAQRAGSRERAHTSARPIQPERAAPPDRPGHALPDDLLRGRTKRARLLRAASQGLRALRAAHAARPPALLRNAGRFRHDSLPQQVRRPARRSAAAGRGRLEPPAAGPAAADRRRRVLSGGTGDVGEDAGRGRRGRLRRSHARRRGEEYLRQDGARAEGAAGKDDSGSQAPRRHAAPPVHAGAGPDVPPGPPAGTVAGSRLFPQPVRAGA